jgi:hypothetical protein
MALARPLSLGSLAVLSGDPSRLALLSGPAPMVPIPELEYALGRSHAKSDIGVVSPKHTLNGSWSWALPKDSEAQRAKSSGNQQGREKNHI